MYVCMYVCMHVCVYYMLLSTFLQAASMFFGEMLCFAAFKIWYFYRRIRKQDMQVFGSQKFNPLLWAIPAMCDLLGTSTMYVGLTWTYAASFQMLRGSVIIFTGLLSVAFLGSKLLLRHWIGMILVIIGLVVVGVGDVVFTSGAQGYSPTLILAGDLLIVLAQIITAIQMTVEEKIIKKYEVQPLQGVGWEGIFGFSVLTVLLVPMFFIPWHLPASEDFWQETTRFEDSIDAFHQIGNSWRIALASFGLIISIAFFNFSGLTVTKTMDATTRMVLDSVRTIFIWAFSLAIGWQTFEPLQPVGYIILFVGTCIYYNLIIMPTYRWLAKKLCYYRDSGHEKTPLLINEPVSDRDM